MAIYESDHWPCCLHPFEQWTIGRYIFYWHLGRCDGKIWTFFCDVIYRNQCTSKISEILRIAGIMWVSIHWKILIDLAISEYHCLTRHVIRLDILVSILHTSYFRFCDILNFVMSRGLLDRKRSQTKMTYVYTSISMTSSLKIEDLRVYITVHTI